MATDLEVGKKSQNGCIVTKTAGIVIVLVVGLLVAGAALLAYYVPERNCTASPPPTVREPIESRMPTPIDVPDNPPTEEGRLPDTLVPFHYNVYLKAYIDDEEYPAGEKFLDIRGNTKIFVNCSKPTNEIYLHVRTVTITESSIDILDITGEQEQSVSVSSTDDSEVSANQWYIIKTVEQLQQNHQYSIYLEHVGTLNQTDYYGFYYAPYEENGENKLFAATQFESRHARRAFPCFDEPALKATFNTTLVYRPGRIALSNTDVVSNTTITDSLDKVWIVTQYEQTVVMSTYLNAYTIGDWACIQNTTRNNITFGVCSQPSLIHQAEYALYVGMEQTSMFEDLFEMNYALPKMDMPALPVFSPGAMENWGLILYREVYIIYDPDEYTAARKKGVAGVIAHELAHQWFGNAVTMEWWDELWLNEGFATFYQYYGLDFSEKGFETFDQFFLKDNTYRAFQSDQVGTSRPVIAPRTSSRMIYQKGSVLIEMMRNFLGEDILFEGFRRYLKKHEWGNAVSDDLWQALTETNDELTGVSMKESLGYDMKDLMDPWFRQMGFPVVTLTRASTNVVTATQQQFLLDPNDSPQDKYYTNLGYVWHVPLTYTHEAEKNFQDPKRLWLHKTGGSVVIEGLTNVDWYIANINQSAYIRVNYDVDNWRKLAKQLQYGHTVLPVRNRAHLIDDSFHLGQAQLQDHVIALEIIEYLKSENEYMPWQAFVADQYYTKYMLWRSFAYGTYEKYIRNLMAANHDSMGWQFDYRNEDTDYYRRLDTLRVSCDYSNPDCVNAASSQFKEWMADPDNNNIEPDMRSTVYCTAIRYGTDAEWQFAYDRQKDDSTERGRLRSAMACTRASWTLQGYMEEALESSAFDARTTIGYVRDNSGLGFDLAWAFTIENFESLESAYGDGAYDIVWSFASKMNTDKDLQALNDFGAKYYTMPGSAANGFYDAVQTVETNIKWADRNMGDIALFLDAYSYSM